MKLNNTVKGAFCVCGAFLIHFSLGTLYTFGNMSPYIASYLRFKTSNTWVTTGHTVWILAATLFLMGVLMAVGGLLEKRIGIRLTCLFGCLSMSFNVSITFFTIQKNLWLVILTYGVGVGFGVGISYSVALTTAMKWFPNQKGMISGIVVGGFGLGSFLFNLIQTNFINPSNIPPRFTNNSYNFANNSELLGNLSVLTNTTMIMTTSSQEKYFFDEVILKNVPMCFVIIGVGYAVLQIIGVILLMDPQSLKSEENINMENLDGNKLNENDRLLEEDITSNNRKSSDLKIVTKTPKSSDYTVGRALKNRMFWLLWSTFFLNGLVIVTISAVYKSFGQQFIGDDQYFAILGAVGGICNCIGRVVWGRLFDKFSYKIVMSALTVLMAVSMGTFFFTSFIQQLMAAKIVYFIVGMFLFIAHAGSFAILPSGTAQCFGSANLATIYGLIFTGLACASIIGAVVSSFFFNLIQYKGQFIMATIAAIISLILTQFFHPPRNWN